MTIRYLRRYRDATRMNHWFVAMMFFAAGLSGLAFFHPSLFFFSALFGGGQWTRILHPFLGVAMVLGFFFLFFTMWRENLLDRNDRDWIRHAPKMLQGDKAGMPPVGKYNAGQKFFFWMAAVTGLLILLTGVVLWWPTYFNQPLRSISILLHDLCFIGFFAAIVGHIYLGTAAEPGTFRSMTRGTVTKAWAKLHHARWYRDVMGDRRS